MHVVSHDYVRGSLGTCANSLGSNEFDNKEEGDPLVGLSLGENFPATTSELPQELQQ